MNNRKNKRMALALVALFTLMPLPNAISAMASDSKMASAPKEESVLARHSYASVPRAGLVINGVTKTAVNPIKYEGLYYVPFKEIARALEYHSIAFDRKKKTFRATDGSITVRIAVGGTMAVKGDERVNIHAPLFVNGTAYLSLDAVSAVFNTFAYFHPPNGSVRVQRPATTYKVQKGDSLYRIAQAHHTTAVAVREANGLRTNVLLPGQVLRLPAEVQTKEMEPARPGLARVQVTEQDPSVEPDSSNDQGSTNGDQNPSATQNQPGAQNPTAPQNPSGFQAPTAPQNPSGFQNPTAPQNPSGFQNPSAPQNPSGFQTPSAPQNPAGFQTPSAPQNPAGFQTPSAPQNPSGFQAPSAPQNQPSSPAPAAKKAPAAPQSSATTPNTAGSTAAATQSASASSKAQAIIATGKKYMGAPYKFGAKPADAPRQMDCSSFVQYVFKVNGITLPRDSRQQSATGTTVSKSALQPGDLLFFKYPERYSDGRVGHVGIYMGNGQMIHTVPKTGVTITKYSTSNYWNTNFLFAKRVISP